ncbi:MAG: phage baseplate protein [Lactobacillus helveticus]
MSYEKQAWSKYDALKPEEENIENGAVVTDSRMNHMENGIEVNSNAVENHIANKLNPHSVTKNQVGLGNVQNFGLATEDEAKQGDSNAKYMTPSLTQAVLSANINSIAYANSADGTDGFTTVYPNLNLLVNSSAKTKDGFFKNFDKVENGYGEVTIKGTNTWVAKDLGEGFSIQPRNYKPGDKYTMSMDVMFTSWNLPAGTTIPEFWLGQRYFGGSGKRICSIDLPKDPSKMLNQWIRITQTSTIPPYDDPSVGTQAIVTVGFFGPSEGSITFRVRKPKQEQGPTATPYMRSASEVTTTDWPKFVGFSNTVKTNKSASDYTWFPDLTNKVEDHVNNKSNPHGVTASQVGSYTKSEVATLISEAIKQSKLDANPIGTILTTISNTNPSTYIGGTWERFANGRTLVGVDETDDVTLMKTANKMGGSTNPITEHRHDFGKVGSQQTYTFAWGTGTYTTSQVYLNTGQIAAGAAPNNNLLTKQHADLGGTTNSGNNTDHNNWQPFATVYFWRRTA